MTSLSVADNNSEDDYYLIFIAICFSVLFLFNSICVLTDEASAPMQTNATAIVANKSDPTHRCSSFGPTSETGSSTSARSCDPIGNSASSSSALPVAPTNRATPVSFAPVIKQQPQSRRPTTPANTTSAPNTNADRSDANGLEGNKSQPMSNKAAQRTNGLTKRVTESDLKDKPRSTPTPSAMDRLFAQKTVQNASEVPSSTPAESAINRCETPSSTLGRRGRLTTEDLLIIIHNSKKKHNIKTEPEIIIPNSPPSSRSPSNASNSPTSPTNNVQPVIPTTPSRTPQQTNATTDRRSWNGNETPSPSVSTPGSRRSLASDRMGPTKATTIQDFKRLLSQTRSNTFTNDRMSATEILRANAKRPLTPVINYITSFVGSGSKSKVTPSPAPTPKTPTQAVAPAPKQTVTPTVSKQLSRASPAPSVAPPPQINGAINSNTQNLIKPRIINHRHSFRHPPSYRMDNVCQPILEDSAEETDDKKCAQMANHKQQLINNYNRCYTQKVINTSPVINNFSKAVANPQSTSTWV